MVECLPRTHCLSSAVTKRREKHQRHERSVSVVFTASVPLPPSAESVINATPRRGEGGDVRTNSGLQDSTRQNFTLKWCRVECTGDANDKLRREGKKLLANEKHIQTHDGGCWRITNRVRGRHRNSLTQLRELDEHKKRHHDQI